MLHSLKFPQKKTGSHWMISPQKGHLLEIAANQVALPTRRTVLQVHPGIQVIRPRKSWKTPTVLQTWKMSKILNKTNWGPIMGPNLFGIFFHFWGECFLHFLIGPMENWCHLGFCWVELPSLLNEPVQKTHGFQMYLFFPPPLLAISKVSISTPFPSRLQQQIKTPGLGRSRPMVRKIHKDLGATKFEVFTN